MILATLMSLTGMVGCSQGSGVNDPLAPREIGTMPPASPTGTSVVLGYFQFVFGDEGNVTVKEAEPVRGAQFNVGAFASVIIEDFYFDEFERNWYVTASIKNISIFTGYDVWAVFHSLGEKYLVNQDGFIWALPPIFPEPTRCAFVAYGKSQPDRIYPPMFQDTRTIVIHQPEGMPKLPPIGFWIDATAHPRKGPAVEDLALATDDGTNFQLTGFIWDHQSPSSDLTVWADCSNFNGEQYVPLFDDGEHGDGASGDNIFGCAISGGPNPGNSVITVYAFDPLENSGENDVRFGYGDDPPPPPCQDFWVVDAGDFQNCEAPFKGLIDNQQQWEEYWMYCHGDGYIPYIGFEEGMAAYVINLGEKPTSGYWVEVNGICEYPDNSGMTVLWTEWDPGETCIVEDVITHPWIVVAFKNLGLTYNDEGMAAVYECTGGGDVLWEYIEEGQDSCAEPGEYGFNNFGDEFTKVWSGVHCWGPDEPGWMPGAPPAEPGYQWVPFIIQLTEKPSSGYYTTVDYIYIDGLNVYVYYSEYTPGFNCPVEAVMTKPWSAWMAQLPQIIDEGYIWNFMKSEIVYDCNEPCDQVPFYQLGDGKNSCAAPGEYSFENFGDYEQFWYDVNCWDPDQGTPPPLPEDPWPIQDGEIFHFAVQLPEYPTTGYTVTIDNVCVNGADVYVQYTEFYANPDCDIFPTLTQPWIIGAVELKPMGGNYVWHFEKMEGGYACPGENCYDFVNVAGGMFAECPDPFSMLITSQDEWEGYWNDCHPGDEMPFIDFESGLAAYAIHIGERPTTGYEVSVYEVCQPWEPYWSATVRWLEWIPGKFCKVDQVVTHPWRVVAFKLDGYKYYDEGVQETWWCNK